MELKLCLPGNSFSGMFMERYTAFIARIAQTWTIEPIFRGGSHVSFVRECLLGESKKPDDPTRVPFDGKPYDYILWIDSDIIFTWEHWESMWNKISADPEMYCICGGVPKTGSDEIFFLEMSDQNPDDMRYMKRQAVIEKAKSWKLIELFHASFGFVLMRKGMLEKMGPPWFFTNDYEINGAKSYCVGEDVVFFHNARKAGFKIWGDPSVIVGHQKLNVF